MTRRTYDFLQRVGLLALFVAMGFDVHAETVYSCKLESLPIPGYPYAGYPENCLGDDELPCVEVPDIGGCQDGHNHGGFWRRCHTKTSGHNHDGVQFSVCRHRPIPPPPPPVTTPPNSGGNPQSPSGGGGTSSEVAAAADDDGKRYYASREEPTENGHWDFGYVEDGADHRFTESCEPAHDPYGDGLPDICDGWQNLVDGEFDAFTWIRATIKDRYGLALNCAETQIDREAFMFTHSGQRNLWLMVNSVSTETVMADDEEIQVCRLGVTVTAWDHQNYRRTNPVDSTMYIKLDE